MTAPEPAELDTLINTLAKAVKPVVTVIESGPAITKDHYSEYLGVITKVAAQLPAAGRNVHLGIGIALQRAGANKAGVQAALRILGAI